MIKCWWENSSKAYCIRLWIRPEGLGSRNKLEERHLLYYVCRKGRDGRADASRFLQLTVRPLSAGFYFPCGVGCKATCEEGERALKRWCKENRESFKFSCGDR